MIDISNTSHRSTETPSASAALDPTLELVADRLPAGLFAPYLATAVALAMSYGSSFLLPDALLRLGYSAATAGTVVGTGTVATLVGALFAGRLVERAGLLSMIAASAMLMAAAMACFAVVGIGGLPIAYAGGLLLGLGWALFYMLAPLQIIHSLRPSGRLEALTLLSGSQMLGIGLSAPVGRLLADHLGGARTAFAAYAVSCLLAAAACLLMRPRMAQQRQLPMRAVALSAPAILSILRARTVAPVLMMGVAACTFAGLSTFQSLYAASRGMTPDIFFLTFTVTTVVLRFTVASLIGTLPLMRLAMALFTVTLLGIGLLLANERSWVLYVAASVLFATGYGLTYSTLNAMVVNWAGSLKLSIPVASQVFTLGYFIGLFGFPVVAGRVIAGRGIDTALLVMMGTVSINLAIAAWMLKRRRGLAAAPRPRS